MDLFSMKNLSDFQTHLQVACQTQQRLQQLLKDGRLEVDGACLDISAVVAVAQ
jgi:hypothetical protein